MDDKMILSQLHSAVATYRMPDAAKQLMGSGSATILCGVTAAGKNTIVNYLVAQGAYEHVVSHTTRQPRFNHGKVEKNGVEYWFCNNAEMLDLVVKQAFIEVKAIHGDTCYGTSISSIKSVIDAGKHPVMEIDVQGALELTQVVPNLRPLFVLPPSYEVWMQRLNNRGSISEEEKLRRLRSASMEIETALDHPAFLLVVNHEVEITAAQIMQGIDDNPEEQTKNRALAEDLLEIIRKV